MNTKQRIFAIFILVLGLVISGCAASPALSPTPTTIPFPPTPAPIVTQVSFPTDSVPPTPITIPFVTETSELPEVGGTYAINGIAPDGKVYSGLLSITLNSEYSGSSTKQPVYALAWDNGLTGVGILIKDAWATSFLATSFGGPSCKAVFYSVFPYMDGDSSTFTLNGIWLSPGTLEISSEVASPISPRPYLYGDYNVAGFTTNGSERKGTLSIIQRNPQVSIWQLDWKVGQSYSGTGISLNKSLFAAAYGGEGCGISVYEVKTDGSLHAVWAVWGVRQVGEETATK